MKVWCYVCSTGRICADSSFRTEDEVWRVMLGWPTKGEVKAAKERGDRVIQIDVVIT